MALNDTLTGEVCHIKGLRAGSARYDVSQTDVERNDYTNLVLMCPTHHTVIDDDEEAYPADRLLKIKSDHEASSTPINDEDATATATLFVQSVASVAQSGGVSVNANTINMQGAPSTHHLTRQRQIQAVEHLWQVSRNLRDEFGGVVFVNTLLMPSELEAYFKDGDVRIADSIREYADVNAPARKLAKAGADEADRERSFVTSRLWAIFFVLRAMYGRTAILIANSYKKREFLNWRDDDGCDQLLRSVLPSRVVEDARAREVAGLQTAFDYLESAFLTEAGMNSSVQI